MKAWFACICRFDENVHRIMNQSHYYLLRITRSFGALFLYMPLRINSIDCWMKKIPTKYDKDSECDEHPIAQKCETKTRNWIRTHAGSSSFPLSIANSAWMRKLKSPVDIAVVFVFGSFYYMWFYPRILCLFFTPSIGIAISLPLNITPKCDSPTFVSPLYVPYQMQCLHSDPNQSVFNLVYLFFT